VQRLLGHAGQEADDGEQLNGSRACFNQDFQARDATRRFDAMPLIDYNRYLNSFAQPHTPLEVSMLFLPKSCARLADCCATELGRISMTGVLVREYEDSYSLAATDGRRLLIVRGPNPEYTINGGAALERLATALEDAPNGTFESTVPAKAWKDAFKGIDKKVEHLALVMGEKEFTFAFGGHLLHGEPVEGRFPLYEHVLPKHEPKFTIRVNVDYLLSLAAAIKPFTDEGGAVDVHFYGGNIPFGFSCKNEHGQMADAILMPLM
jgi:DNA polymerase III sliding clamp (beta) subunit (PCNA family)